MLFRTIASVFEQRHKSIQNLFEYQITRLMSNKYTQHQGVKGIRNRKSLYEINNEDQNGDNSDIKHLNLDDREYDAVANAAMHLTHNQIKKHNVFVIQPYIKWGPNKNVTTNPDSQLKEAEALVRSLPNWSVELAIKVPLESINKKTLFGTGKLEELKAIIAKQRSLANKSLTCLFISKSTLSFPQKRFLEAEFKLPVMDRYSMVIQILRLHAISAEAKIQVAMAEIPYIWSQMKEDNLSMSRKQGYFLNDTQREILKNREQKLKQELVKIRNQRKLLRNKRKLKDYPIVAVLGYTNAGKTSLIKALTGEQSMQPKNQLFATLDVTAHAGLLPCNLEVLYMDTVGFMSDLPTGLLECFVATLEDAMLADVIVHVQDVSHENFREQRAHVELTLESLTTSLALNDYKNPPIINVGNKIDLVSRNKIEEVITPDLKLVSSITHSGFNELTLEIEQKIFEETNRKKITMRVPNGGAEMSWLYKNSAVVKTREDKKNSENILIDVIISETKMQQFKHYFCKIPNTY